MADRLSWRRRICSSFAVLAFGGSQQALATEAPIPPADVPSLVAAYRPAPDDVGQFQKYFYFQKTGVSAESANADINECRGYASDLIFNPILPTHLPPKKMAETFNTHQYGLVGDVMVSAIQPSIIRAIAAANMRKCMGFKGYSRHGLSKSLWAALNPEDPIRAVALQVQVAIGPAPVEPSLVP
jgi:hypothetical protein